MWNKVLVLQECVAYDVLGSVNGGAKLFCSLVVMSAKHKIRLLCNLNRLLKMYPAVLTKVIWDCAFPVRILFHLT